MAKNTPDVRFRGFRENWKCIKIDDVINEKKRSIVLDDNTTYQLITVKRRNEGIVSRGFLKGKQILVKNYFEVKAGDYVISKRQVVHGANGIVPEKLDGAIVSNEYLVAVENEDLTTKFLTLISKLPDMYKKFFISSYGVDIEKLVFDVDDWKKREFSIPTIDEQGKITAFFNDFDELCSAEQQKYDKLANLKKGMLDKMFPQNGSHVPVIRFKGFSESWERKKFGDMYEKVSQKNDLSYGIDRIISVANMYFKSNVYISDEEYLRTYNVFKLGDIAFEGNKSKDFAHGRFVENSIGNGIVSHVFDVFRPKTFNYDLQFWKYAINNEQLMGSILIRCTKSSTMMTNLVATDFLKEHFFVPCLDEQAKIGAFFQNLDRQIILQKEKLQKLINIKKAFLEKMFL